MQPKKWSSSKTEGEVWCDELMSTEANNCSPCQAATILPVLQSKSLIRSKLPIPTNEIGEYRANGIKYCSSTFQKATIMRSWIVKWAVKSTAYIFLTLTHAAITLLRTPWMLVEKKLIDILMSIRQQSNNVHGYFFHPPRNQLLKDFSLQRNATEYNFKVWFLLNKILRTGKGQNLVDDRPAPR